MSEQDSNPSPPQTMDLRDFIKQIYGDSMSDWHVEAIYRIVNGFSLNPVCPPRLGSDWHIKELKSLVERLKNNE